MKVFSHDDSHYYQQITRKTDGFKNCEERCDDLGKSHTEMTLHFKIENFAMFSVRGDEAYYFFPTL